MCGIVGATSTSRENIHKMAFAIHHRGPDDKGVFVDNTIGLGHLRLSIVDLSPLGHQPMHYTHKGRTVTIVFNGEIYNFQEVRTELEKIGYHFHSKSDTEVILAAYIAWGDHCVTRFNGMWAFAIYDPARKRVFCSRDRFGKKPFYYALVNGEFIFASELKGLIKDKRVGLANTSQRRARIDVEAVQLYFALGFIPSPWTIYLGVRKLEASHNLVFDLKMKTSHTEQYYEIPPYRPIPNKQELIREGRELLKDATRLRLIADVPVGAFLSGGLDSSAVVGSMHTLVDLKKLHTFSIGFEGKYDETPYITVVKDAFGTRHHHAYFGHKDFEQILPIYAQMYDEPFGDFSGFPTLAVSELARKYVTVALSGDGGDEIFGGYMTHVTGHRLELLKKIPAPLRALGAKMPTKKNLNGFANPYLLKKAFELTFEDPAAFYAKALVEDGIKPEVYTRWTMEKLRNCLHKSGGNLPEALRLYDLLYQTIPDHFLVKVDRASMHHALEVRSPFLDYRFVEFSQRIPAHWKVDSFKTKKLMREIIKDIVPEEIVKRGKQGFTPPLAEWIHDKKYETVTSRGLEHLKTVDSSLATFFEKRVLLSRDALNTNYHLRLFLYGLWIGCWLN
jgi:asparagine synthase (glutamine-hydrolysing)